MFRREDYRLPETDQLEHSGCRIDNDVGRIDGLVDDVAGVDFSHYSAGFDGDSQALKQAERPRAQQSVQGFTPKILQHQPRYFPLAVEAMDGDRACAGEAAQQAVFVPRPPPRLRHRHAGLEGLENDRETVFFPPRPVDHGSGAGVEGFIDSITG